MKTRERYQLLRALRKLQPGLDRVYEQEPGPTGKWYAVPYRGLADDGQVIVEDVLWVNPRKDKLVAVEDIRLSNPDEQVKLRPPSPKPSLNESGAKLVRRPRSGRTRSTRR